MRGKDEQQLDVFSDISPEQRVPHDHPLRPLRVMTDEALREFQPRFNKLYAKTGRPARHLHCANFCAHPTDRWAHLGTASHMLRSRLSCFVSAETLKTGRLFLVARLPWAQEVWSSNLHAPTKSL